MKILLLSHYFPPEVNAPATRTYEHAVRWTREGHDVTVVTCAPNCPDGVVFPGYRNRFRRQVEHVDGVRVVRVWTYLAPNAGTIRRIANYLSYMVSAVLASVRLARPDVVVATSPQFFCGWAGVWVSRLKWRPFVLEIRDIWPESIGAVGAIRRPWLLRSLEWLERRMYRAAQHIVTVGNGYRDRIRARLRIEDRGSRIEDREAEYGGWKMEDSEDRRWRIDREAEDRGWRMEDSEDRRWRIDEAAQTELEDLYDEHPLFHAGDDHILVANAYGDRILGRLVASNANGSRSAILDPPPKLNARNRRSPILDPRSSVPAQPSILHPPSSIFPPPPSISVITNGVDLERFVPASDDHSFRRQWGLEGKFVCSYVGTIGMAHGLEVVLDAAWMLSESGRDDIRFVLVGDGAERARLQLRARELGVDGLVVFTGRLPKDDMPRVLAASDACLVHLRGCELFESVIPSKLFEIMAMRRPIIMGVRGEACEMVLDAGAGLEMEPDSASSLVACVEKLADTPGLVEELGRTAREYVAQNFSRDVLAARYLKLLESIAGPATVQAPPAPESFASFAPLR